MLRSRILSAMLVTALVSTITSAQAPAPGTTVLNATTQLVQVDVVVTDASGKQVHGMKSEDFRVSENRKPQTIRNFEETLSVAPTTLATMPKVVLSPGTFTDYSPIPDKAPLTILLLDHLNTPVADQQNMQKRLIDFLRNEPPNSRTALFGMSAGRLIMLQGFTSDHEALKAAVEARGLKASQIIHTGETSIAEAKADAGLPVSAGLAQFEAEVTALTEQIRIRYTLDDFKLLAAYLGGFPGRKNVVWFSASFPLTTDFNPNIQYGFQTESSFADSFHKVVNLLARARVAIYPVEAGGLATDPTFSFAAQGPATLKGQLQGTAGFQTSQGSLHNTMNQLATETGGKAFYNNNDLAGAVRDSVANGAEYYTLSYTPTSHAEHDEFRSIKVELTNAAASQNLKLSYRRGYYVQTHKADKKETDTTPETDPVVLAALQHGAPAPSEILFKVRILPATAPISADGRQVLPPPGEKFFTLDYTALTNHIELPQQPDGTHAGKLDFAVYEYDQDGKMLHSDIKSLTLKVAPADFANIARGGVGFSQTVRAPSKAVSLRIAILDRSSGHLGVVEVPLSAVRNLPPAPPAQ